MDVTTEVARLKAERDAVILAHYYVPSETQALADYVGDSFYLARLARTLDCSTIVLCGVSFMAESAKMLNPERTVLLPDPTADCPMAHMVRKEDVETVKARYDDRVLSRLIERCGWLTMEAPDHRLAHLRRF